MIASHRQSPRRAVGATLLASLLLLLAGCFTADEEIFSATEAQLVPGLAGQYRAPDASLTLFRVPESNDYRFILSPKDETPSSGVFRVLTLGGTLDLIQAHLDSDPPRRFNYLLFNLTMGAGRVATIAGMEVDEAAAKALARRLDVSIEGGGLVGSAPALKRFLMGLGALPLAPGKIAFSRAE